mmetsp:Transcript_22334/g.40403  ORF Transcript_22334/g.40403 Transcript_22334/m.40403 type:complete len:80 (+) Transcript_22334:390-629(+)
MIATSLLLTHSISCDHYSLQLLIEALFEAQRTWQHLLVWHSSELTALVSYSYGGKVSAKRIFNEVLVRENYLKEVIKLK